MKRIQATLPALGSYTVHFHNESEEVLDYLGDKELGRLDRVQHLGIASKVFTGVNHSRLEYLLLQCAIISLLPKFHSGKEPFALSGKVYIPNQKSKFSSGEELLKCWALLGNSGHAQYTFGVERSLLNHARDNSSFKKILIGDLPANLKKWAASSIDDYEDHKFHYILSLIKISQLPSGSRLKGRLFRILATLLIPISELNISSSSNRYKIYRLRNLFSRVRLLSIVALDAYYSHHPVRYQISGALMNLDALLETVEEKSEFLRLLEQTASWLADEIYLHPRSAAAQKLYEVDAKRKLNGAYAPRVSTSDNFKLFLPNCMNNGFGQPKVDGFRHLARLTFPYWRVGSVFGKDIYEISGILEDQLSKENDTSVSVLLNPYSRNIHIDLLYDKNLVGSQSIATLCFKTTRWISRLIEAQILHRLRSISFPQEATDEFKKEVLDSLRKRYSLDIIKPAQPALKSLFNGVIKYILPEDVIGSASEVMPRQGVETIGLKFGLIDGSTHDSITKTLDDTVKNNPNELDADRIHEVKALQHYIQKSKAPFIATCHEKFVIRGTDGGDRDDWDGIVLEIYPDKVTVTVIEAKNIKPAASRETQAFKQLEETRKLVRKKQSLSARRKKMPGYGALITFSL